MPAHKHWRLYITDIEDAVSLYCRVAEVQMRASVGGSDQCRFGVASASESYSTTPPSFAFDDGSSTYWSSNGGAFPVWLRYEFAAPVYVAEFTIQAPDITPAARAPSEFQLQWSDNGTDWTPEASYSGLTWAVSEIKTFAGGEPGPTYLPSGISKSVGYAVLDAPDGAVVSKSVGYAVLVEPGVDSVEPASGHPAGGTEVLISGAGFESGATVTFGGTPLLGPVVLDDETIVGFAPAHVAGAVDVVVTVGVLVLTLTNGFTYIDPFRIDSITPSTVHVSGGTIEIEGDGYEPTALILIDDVPVGVTYESPQRLWATAVAHAAGTVTLRVQLEDGSYRETSITFAEASLLAVDPTSARAFELVTVTGVGLAPTAGARIGGVDAETTWVSASELAVRVPLIDPGTYDVEVLNPDADGEIETLTLPAALTVLAPLVALSSGSINMYVVP